MQLLLTVYQSSVLELRMNSLDIVTKRGGISGVIKRILYKINYDCH